MWPFSKKEIARGSANTDNEKAAQLAAEFLRLGSRFGKQFFRTILGRDAGPADDEKQFRLALETFYFSTYLTGRLTAHLHTAPPAREFLAQIREAACRILFQAQPGAEKVNFTDYAGAIESGWQATATAYDRCPSAMPEKDSVPLEGTLFWEFSKRLLAAVETPDADSVGATLKVALELSDAVLLLVEAAGYVSSD